MITLNFLLTSLIVVLIPGMGSRGGFGLRGTLTPFIDALAGMYECGSISSHNDAIGIAGGVGLATRAPPSQGL